MVERFFDEDDAHFTGTFGKWLDTHARFDSITAALAADAGRQRIDVDWAIEWLAYSRDNALEAIRRTLPGPPDPLAAEPAFGPVPRTVFGQPGSIEYGRASSRERMCQYWWIPGVAVTLQKPQN